MDSLMLYFGYGSNLCARDLSTWCRSRGLDDMELIPVGPAFLPDRRLAFTHRSTARGGGVLDIPGAKGCTVQGVLFRVASEDDIATLDRKEGEGHAYRRIETIALTDDGRESPCVTYEVVPDCREPFVVPARDYLAIVQSGYAAHMLDVGPLTFAARGEWHRGPIAELFAYGTLRHGENRHAVLARHGAEGGVAATTAGTLLDLGPYPGLLLGPNTSSVVGELYEPPEPGSLYAELDKIESFRGFGAQTSLFRRAVVRIHRAGACSSPAWTYIYSGARDGGHEIVSGDWHEHRQARQRTEDSK